MRFFALWTALVLSACTLSETVDADRFDEVSEAELLKLMEPYAEDSDPNFYFHGGDRQFYYFSERTRLSGRDLHRVFFPRRVKVPKRPDFFGPEATEAYEDLSFPLPRKEPIYQFQVGWSPHVAASRAERMALELIDSGPAQGQFISIGPPFVDLSTMELMHDMEASRGGHLAAVLRAPLAADSFKVYVLAQRDEGPELQITESNWGKILYKGRWHIHQEALDGLLELVGARLSCAEVEGELELSNSLAVYWRSGLRLVCRSSFHPLAFEAPDRDMTAVLERLAEIAATGELKEESSATRP